MKIIIIGGGPGGYVAAIRAAQLGAQVTVIERDRLGGTCLNRGCIPTKALYASAKRMKDVGLASELGIEVSNAVVNMEKVQAHKANTVDTLVGGIEQILKGRKINLIYGMASFKSNTELVVQSAEGEETVTGDYIILAAGSKPSSVSIPGLDHPDILDSTSMLELKNIPKTIAIIGGGVIGMEFADIFQSFGSAITVLEKFDMLMGIDTDITKRFVARHKRMMDIHVGTDTNKIEKTEAGFTLHCENKKKGAFVVEVEQVLAAVGRVPDFKALELQNTDISYDRFVHVDANLQTNVKNIYCIGDMNGIAMLAHAASDQGIQAVDHIINQKPVVKKPIPACVFTFPEIAAVGITEDEAKATEISYISARFMYGANGKALSMGEGDGFIKVIADSESRKLLGVHIMGPHASDLIGAASVMVSMNHTIDELAGIIHAHPTLPETLHEAILAAAGMPIHSL